MWGASWDLTALGASSLGISISIGAYATIFEETTYQLHQLFREIKYRRRH